MKTDRLLAICTFLLIFTVGVAVYQNRVLNKYKSLLEQVDTTLYSVTDTVYKTIVITDSVPKYINNTVVKTDTFYTNNGDTIKVNLKKKEITNTIIQEEDTLQYLLCIEGRSLETEDYPKLDSIKFNLNKKIITTTNTIIIEKPVNNKQSRWNVTAGVGTGYGVINKQADIYLGFTIGYRLW